MESIKTILQNVGSSIQQKPTPLIIERTWLEYFKTKNFIILFLLTIIILLFLGINIIILFGNIFQSIIYALMPLISSILLLFGVSINTIGDLFDSIGDLIDSILHIFGDGIQTISKHSFKDNNYSWNKDIYAKNNVYPSPNDTNSSIQQSNMSNKKQSWCLIGDSNLTKTCVPISESTKCMSGMVYDSEQSCTNPITTDNNPITKTVSGNGTLGFINKVYYPNMENMENNISSFKNKTSNPKNNIIPITSLPDGSIKSKNKSVQNIQTTYPTSFF